MTCGKFKLSKRCVSLAQATSKNEISRPCIISDIPTGNDVEPELFFGAAGFGASSILIFGLWISMHTCVHFNWMASLLIDALMRNCPTSCGAISSPSIYKEPCESANWIYWLLSVGMRVLSFFRMNWRTNYCILYFISNNQR